MKATPITAQSGHEFTEDEIAHASEAMQKFGGGFASAIGVALVRADHINRARLVAAFPDLVSAYKDISK